jgi:hypothetical protein
MNLTAYLFIAFLLFGAVGQYYFVIGKRLAWNTRFCENCGAWNRFFYKGERPCCRCGSLVTR